MNSCKCDELGCVYRDSAMRDDGKGGRLHCYMFKDAPQSLPCAQLRTSWSPVKKQRLSPMAAVLASLFGIH